MEIKRNIMKEGSSTGETYVLTLFNGRYIWYLCASYDSSCPLITINRKWNPWHFYIPFEPDDLNENL